MPELIRFLDYVPLNTHSEDLGQKLVAFRRSRGISQKVFAKLLGVDQSTLARWERGRSRPTRRSLELIEAIEKQLNLCR